MRAHERASRPRLPRPSSRARSPAPPSDLIRFSCNAKRTATGTLGLYRFAFAQSDFAVVLQSSSLRMCTFPCRRPLVVPSSLRYPSRRGYRPSPRRFHFTPSPRRRNRPLVHHQRGHRQLLPSLPDQHYRPRCVCLCLCLSVRLRRRPSRRPARRLWPRCHLSRPRPAPYEIWTPGYAPSLRWSTRRRVARSGMAR